MTEPRPTPTAAEVRRWLGEIPDMAALLPDALITRSAQTENLSRPVPSSRPPVDVGILDLTDQRHKHDWLSGSMAWCDPDRMGILPYLDSWVRDLEGAAIDGDPIFGIEPRNEPLPDAPEHPTVAAVCDWLAGALEWAEGLPQWFELADGVRQMHQRVRIATRNVRDAEDKPVPCPRCGESLTRVPGTRPLWACVACGHEVRVQAVTINQAAKILQFPKDRLYALVNRPALLDGSEIKAPRKILGETGSRRLYDLNDLSRLVAEIKLRRTP